MVNQPKTSIFPTEFSNAHSLTWSKSLHTCLEFSSGHACGSPSTVYRVKSPISAVHWMFIRSTSRQWSRHCISIPLNNCCSQEIKISHLYGVVELPDQQQTPLLKVRSTLCMWLFVVDSDNAGDGRLPCWRGILPRQSQDDRLWENILACPILPNRTLESIDRRLRSVSSNWCRIGLQRRTIVRNLSPCRVNLWTISYELLCGFCKVVLDMIVFDRHVCGRCNIVSTSFNTRFLFKNCAYTMLRTGGHSPKLNYFVNSCRIWITWKKSKVALNVPSKSHMTWPWSQRFPYRNLCTL